MTGNFHKKALSFLTTLIFGYLSAIIIYGLLLSTIVIIKPTPINGYLLTVIVKIFPLFLLLIIIYTFFNQKKKGYFYFILKPNRTKILLTVSIALFWSILSFFKSSGKLILFNPGNNSIINAGDNSLLAVLAIISTVIFIYPFSAFIYGLKTSFELNSSLKEKVILALLLVISNPVSISFGLLAINNLSYQSGVLNKELSPCGAMIENIVKDSPAYKAGLEPGEIISNINEVKILKREDFDTYFQNLHDDSELVISSQLKTYRLTPYWDDKLNTYAIGLNTSDGYCRKT